MKTLVVYFSRKGYVRKIAEDIARKINADIYEIKSTELTQGIPGFWWCGRFNMHRWEMNIEPVSVKVEDYDKVIICSPVWVFTFCAPVRAFLHQCSGRIKAADYVLVHFSFPMRYIKSVENMDKLLGIRHEKLTSIVCQLGKILSRKEYNNDLHSKYIDI